jgi:uncharacterized protein DUF4154
VAGALCAMRLAASDPEDELKAATVLSFLRYSEWPAAPSGEPSLTVGVLGRPGLLVTFRRVLEGKLVENRPVRVLELPAESGSTCCHIIFLAGEKPGDLKPALALARSMHALTIGAADQFLELGGAIQLQIVDGRMSFEVNREALERSGITISSKLLRFGQIRSAGKGKPPV